MMNWKNLLGKMVVLLSASFLFTGCSTTFLVSKNCKTYFFGSSDQIVYKMLCTSGDLQNILSDSGLPEDTRAGLYDAQCTDRSKKKMDSIYNSMSREQKYALRATFQKHGYKINAYTPLNYRYYTHYENKKDCPPEQPEKQQQPLAQQQEPQQQEQQQEPQQNEPPAQQQEQQQNEPPEQQQEPQQNEPPEQQQ